jgi:hypothetical protein
LLQFHRHVVLGRQSVPPVSVTGETAMSSRLLFLAGGLLVGDGLFFLLVGTVGLGLFL